jgi:hypothetical protein
MEDKFMSSERKINVPLAELVDRLSICQIKELVFNNDNYAPFMKDLENDIDSILPNINIQSQANLIKYVITISISNWIVWFLKDKMASETPNGKSYIEDLKTAQDLNNCIKNFSKNKILELTGELNPATKRTTFIDKRDKEWFTSLLK